jgi:integrase/recombinase XerD
MIQHNFNKGGVNIDNLIEEYKSSLFLEGKSRNTIYNYELCIKEYFSWYNETYNMDFEQFFRTNIMEYKSYLLNVRRYKERNLNAKTVNMKLSSLRNFNRYLVKIGRQENLAIDFNDFVKIQPQNNLNVVDKKEVEEFRQRILVSGDKRLFAIVTLLAYSGLRITEALTLKRNDVDLASKELIVRNSKGNKQRIVYFNSKVEEAIRDYLRTKTIDSEYLFTSNHGKIINRTTINKRFNLYSDKITPHVLRHFFCSYALESGFGVHEVRQIVGHASIRSTQIYLNPSIKSIKSKLEEL